MDGHTILKFYNFYSTHLPLLFLFVLVSGWLMALLHL